MKARYNIEKALVKMHLVGVSVLRVEDIIESPRDSRVSVAMINELNKKVYARIDKWWMRP